MSPAQPEKKKCVIFDLLISFHVQIVFGLQKSDLATTSWLMRAVQV